jgi:hypothetical protein
MKRIIARGFSAAVVAGALGFGAAQALAAPARAGGAEQLCIDWVCNARCEAQWGPFASGRCVDGRCQCAV